MFTDSASVTMAGALTQTVAPTEQPITLQAAKDHLRIETADEDGSIKGMMLAARRFCELSTGRQFVTATWTLKLDAFPATDTILVPLPPLQSVTSITYIDTAGSTQTLATSVYDVDTDSEPGRISLAYNQSWESTRSDKNAVIVTFVAGYGAATAVPADLKAVIQLVLADLYEHREARSEFRIEDNPTVERLLSIERVFEAA